MTTLRPFRGPDLPGVLALLGAACPAEAIDARKLADHILLDEGLEPGGLVVAEAQGRLVGVCHAVVAGRQPYPLPAGRGWLTLLAVDAASRRRGVGRALVEGAAAWLRGRGATAVDVAAYPPGYLVPGVDAERYPGALAFLAACGFRERAAAVGQVAPVLRELPADVAALVARREREGYAFAPATWGDLPELIAWAAASVAPDWGDIVRAAMRAEHRPDRVALCRAPDGGVAGFSMYAAYDGDVARFGPIGVGPEQRGRGLGAILLAQTRVAQAAEGADRSYFLWGEAEGPAFAMYERAGYRINRRFTLLRRDL